MTYFQALGSLLSFRFKPVAVGAQAGFYVDSKILGRIRRSVGGEINSAGRLSLKIWVGTFWYDFKTQKIGFDWLK